MAETGVIPTAIILILPQPPSTNRLWRSDRGIVHRSKDYQQWVRQADGFAMSQHAFRHRKPITGIFEAHILMHHGARLDLDNAVKPLLDWAQARELVRDDKDCHKITVERTLAIGPGEVQLTLTAL